MAGNIAQFNSPIDELHPQEVGAEALARAGRNVGSEYRAIGEQYQRAGDKAGKIITDHEAMSEISQGSAALAVMHNNFTTQWNEMASKSDPNDKSIQGTFLDNTVEPQLQKFQDGFSTERGQNWALAQADSMRSHYYEKTAADMSARAGNAVMLNMKTTLSNLSDTARKDPSSMNSSLDQVDALVAATKEHNTGTLTPEQINKLEDIGHDAKNEIVKSGLQGTADVNPKAAVAAINSGHFSNYITGTEGDSLIKYAEGITRMKLEDQSRAYEQQQRAQKLKEEAVANKVLNTVYNPDTGQISIPDNINQQIFADTSLSAKGKIDLMGAVKHISEDSSRDDPAAMRDNAARLSPGNTHPLTQSDLLAQMGRGQLTAASYNFWNERLKQTPDAVAEKGALSNALQQVQKSILVAPAPGLPPSAEQRQNEIAFTNWFMPAYTAALQDPALNGKSLTEKSQILLSTTDPKGLLTPEKLAPFLNSPQQQLHEGMKSIGPLPSGIGGAEAPAAKPSDISAKADATKYNPTTKQYIYLVNNKWVDAAGKEIK